MKTNVDACYREHGPALLRYLVRMTGDGDLAGDVLHDTFVTLIERPPPRDVHLKGWLFRVATNRLRDAKRRSSRHLNLVSQTRAESVHGDAAPAPDARVMRREAREQAHIVLQSLSARDRSVLLMREEGFTHREIADAVGTTTKSVGTLIARALTKAAAQYCRAETRT